MFKTFLIGTIGLAAIGGGLTAVKMNGGLCGIGTCAVPAQTTTVQTVSVNPGRADCPGLIICPQTGEEICADECPLESTCAGEEAACGGEKAEAAKAPKASCCPGG